MVQPIADNTNILNRANYLPNKNEENNHEIIYDPLKYFSKKVKECRIQKKLSQEKLAGNANDLTSPGQKDVDLYNTIVAVEARSTNISVSAAILISNVLEVPLGDFLPPIVVKNDVWGNIMCAKLIDMMKNTAKEQITVQGIMAAQLNLLKVLSGYNCKEIANKAGLARRTIEYYCRKGYKYTPSLYNVYAIACAFAVPIDLLLPCSVKYLVAYKKISDANVLKTDGN